MAIESGFGGFDSDDEIFELLTWYDEIWDLHLFDQHDKYEIYNEMENKPKRKGKYKRRQKH